MCCASSQNVWSWSERSPGLGDTGLKLKLEISIDINDISLFSPEVRGPSLLWKELGTKTSISRLNGVTVVLVVAA